MIKGFLNLPWFFWAGLALLIALVYSFVWPKDHIAEMTGLRYLALRWGHALTWLLISINFILRGFTPRLDGAANFLAAAGGLTYLLFVIMTFATK